MARLFPWDPWIELESMTEAAQRLAGGCSCALPFDCAPGRTAHFQPVADVLELEDEFQILVELPGLVHEDVAVEVHDKELVVFGERKHERDATGAAFQIMERSYGYFARRFVFPMAVQGKEIQAKMKDGLLVVRIFKNSSESEGSAQKKTILLDA